ncbi:MAG TPA: hypothetical protein VFG10_00210 [Saprospiraceae bacterium]|nr:hypothetical protein [Saprospiraceae bacterium]
MEKYKSLHLWMIIPMLFMQLGIYGDYWGDFSENAWSVHIHYWTGTIWYLFLISQPYMATHGQLARHRTYGTIGIFFAGGVCLTALSMLHRDMVTSERALAAPDKFGPFQPWFFYGVAAVEIVMMTAFGFAVIQAIRYRKELEDHAWWMISTAFLIMMPALGRGVQNLYVGLHHSEFPNVDIMFPIYLTLFIIISLLLLAAWKYKKLGHPATWLALGVNLFIFLLEPLGRSENVQSFLKALIKG